jgi:hypothetical protein
MCYKYEFKFHKIIFLSNIYMCLQWEERNFTRAQASDQRVFFFVVVVFNIVSGLKGFLLQYACAPYSSVTCYPNSSTVLAPPPLHLDDLLHHCTHLRPLLKVGYRGSWALPEPISQFI